MSPEDHFTCSLSEIMLGLLWQLVKGSVQYGEKMLLVILAIICYHCFCVFDHVCSNKVDLHFLASKILGMGLGLSSIGSGFLGFGIRNSEFEIRDTGMGTPQPHAIDEKC